MGLPKEEESEGILGLSYGQSEDDKNGCTQGMRNAPRGKMEYMNQTYSKKDGEYVHGSNKIK